jgi:hypothetical protein
MLDLTCGSWDCCDALAVYCEEAKEGGHEGMMGRISVSSDAGGSLPVFDKQGQLISYGVAEPGAHVQGRERGGRLGTG